VLIQAALERGLWLLAVIVVVSSILAIVYVWRVVETAYFREPAEGAAAATEAPLFMLVPTWVLILANLYFGIDTSLTVGIAEQAAKSLMGVGP
jgi:multicomponent Na+:H+ antiporter subunit D